MDNASIKTFRFRPWSALPLLAVVALMASCQREQPAPPKPAPVIEPVQMPPPPPQPTPEQIAAAEAKAAAEAEAVRKSDSPADGMEQQAPTKPDTPSKPG